MIARNPLVQENKHTYALYVSSCSSTIPSSSTASPFHTTHPPEASSSSSRCCWDSCPPPSPLPPTATTTRSPVQHILSLLIHPFHLHSLPESAFHHHHPSLPFFGVSLFLRIPHPFLHSPTPFQLTSITNTPLSLIVSLPLSQMTLIFVSLQVIEYWCMRVWDAMFTRWRVSGCGGGVYLPPLSSHSLTPLHFTHSSYTSLTPSPHSFIFSLSLSRITFYYLSLQYYRWMNQVIHDYYSFSYPPITTTPPPPSPSHPLTSSISPHSLTPPTPFLSLSLSLTFTSLYLSSLLLSSSFSSPFHPSAPTLLLFFNQHAYS